MANFCLLPRRRFRLEPASRGFHEQSPGLRELFKVPSAPIFSRRSGWRGCPDDWVFKELATMFSRCTLTTELPAPHNTFAVLQRLCSGAASRPGPFRPGSKAPGRAGQRPGDARPRCCCTIERRMPGSAPVCSAGVDAEHVGLCTGALDLSFCTGLVRPHGVFLRIGDGRGVHHRAGAGGGLSVSAGSPRRLLFHDAVSGRFVCSPQRGHRTRPLLHAHPRR